MRPGMYADVRFVRHSYPDAVGVPADAVIYEGTERVIYMVKDAVERVPVQVKVDPGEGGEVLGAGAVRPGLGEAQGHVRRRRGQGGGRRDRRDRAEDSRSGR